MVAVLLLKNWDMLLEENQPPPALLTKLLAYPEPVITLGTHAWHSADLSRQRPIITVRFEPPNDRKQPCKTLPPSRAVMLAEPCCTASRVGENVHPHSAFTAVLNSIKRASCCSES